MKIKIPELKKQLKEFNQKDLIELVVDLYKTNKEVQNYLSSKFLGDEVIEGLFCQACKKVKDEFFPDRGHGKLRLVEAKKAITAFKKATNDVKRTVDLMLFYVEQGVEFTNSFGDIDEGFYTSMAKMFEQVALECDRDEELYNEFFNRLENVVENADGIGWGFSDALWEIYYMIDWVNDEEEDE